MTASPQPEHRPPSPSLVGELVRLGWMLFGFNAVLLAAMGVASHTRWTVGWRDGVYWLIVLTTAFIRYIDIAKFRGETAGGRPATMDTLRRYVAGLFMIAFAIWVVAQAVDL